MGITHASEMKDGTLIVTAAGRDENAKEVIDYGRAVIQLARESDAKSVLCDERNLEYAIGTFDTHQAAAQIAALAPNVRVAIVCRPECLADGKFWEDVAVNRGVEVRVDTDLARAKSWLREGGD